MNHYIEMATRDPRQLLELARSSRDPAELTFIAEALGYVNGLSVWLDLARLLEHAHPVVREGAIYGISRGYTDIFRNQLQHLAETDSSAGVRMAASEALESS